MEQRISLTELVCIQLRKSEAEELQNLDIWEKRYLAGILLAVDAELPPLSEWNRLLRLILKASPEREAKRAKNKLLQLLKGEADR